ncbi:MAG TPA: hypothetical protein PLJ32_08465 [Kiritimatiellia bacterium]|nr:hypothetical protein [Kiritimatiellia bacterium]
MRTNRTKRGKPSFAAGARISVMAFALTVLLPSADVSAMAAKARPAENVIIECDTFSYEITAKGQNVRFVDKASGNDYLKSGDSYCAYAKKDGKTFYPSAVSMREGLLTIQFAHTDLSAAVKVLSQEGRVVYEVQAVSGEPESLTFLNVPLSLVAMPWEPFAACALKLNLFTHVHQLPALQTELWATCYKKFGLNGAKAAFIGVPQNRILPVIRDVLTKAAPEIPFSDQGGAWALTAKEGYGSYLMNFGTLTEQTVDQWIADCRRVGFNQIDNHGGSQNFFLFGSFEMDKKRFPEEWQSFKKIVDKLHAAGISSILHTYACYIAPSSRYVTPVPHPELDTIATYTLAEPLSEDAKEIVVRESTAGVSLDVGYRVTNNRTLRIGDEIIRYNGVTTKAPFTFTGCQRGYHGTRVAAHAAGARAGLLTTFWSGLYVPKPDSPLFDEIAKNTADVINECGFDGLYLDAIEGIRDMWGEENYWYYGDRFVFEIARHLKKPVGMEYAGMMHGWWFYRSRYQAWDSATRGYKRFIDIHIAAMKANSEYQHGHWNGNLPLIEKYAPMESYPLFLPLQFGWWGLRTWDGPKTEPTYSDDIEYLCCKMIGNNAGLSLNCLIDETALQAHPVYRDFLAMIKQYEELRHQNYFSNDVRAKLRQVGKEFTLFREADGRWNFKPVSYQKHKVCGLQHPSASWTIDNEHAAQPLKLRLEALVSVARDPSPVVLLDAENTGEFRVREAADGVTAALKPAGLVVPATGEAAVEFTGHSTGAAVREGAYVSLGKTFDPPLNLGNKLAVGVWVHGGGSGALLNVRLLTRLPNWRMSNHYVLLDFKGWKYVELVESESTRSSDYLWPNSSVGYYVYSHYTGRATYDKITSVEFWFNNLPPNQTVSCKLGPVKALDIVTEKITNPSVTLNGATLTFPVTMESGMYLELKQQGACKLHDKDGKTVCDVVPKGDVPLLKNGPNEVTFQCEKPDQADARVQITLFAEGNPL